MDDGAVERAQERVEQRADEAAMDTLLVRAREQVEALVAATSGLEQSVHEAVRSEAQPVGRNLAEIRGLMNQVLRRLSALESDLLAERNGRVDDLAVLVDLVSSGWQGIDARLGRIEAVVTRLEDQQDDRGAVVYRMEDRRPDAAIS